MMFLSKFDVFKDIMINSLGPGGWAVNGFSNLFTGNDIISVIYGGFKLLMYELSILIYKLIIEFYEIFEALCGAKLLEHEVIGKLATRVGVILGLIMFFQVSFSFIVMILNPDTVSDKEKGAFNIIKKVVLVVVMLGLSTPIFGWLSDIQDIVIKEGLVNKLLLPYDVNTDDFGAVLSSELFISFYNVNEEIDFDPESGTSENVEDEDDLNRIKACYYIRQALPKDVALNRSFSMGTSCVIQQTTVSYGDGIEDENVFIMDFNWLLCLIVGIFVVWMLGSYCISVGIRVFQLTILQMISPMAIVGYLSPKKDNMFSKWLKIYVATYIDIFIRVAIINLVVYLIAILLDSWGDTGSSVFWTSVNNPTGFTRLLIGIIMIVALLSFAKKAPELIKELLPASASKLGFGIGFKDREGLGMLGGALAGGVTGLIGGIAGGKGISKLTGAFTGLTGGAGRGFSGGGKAKDLRSAITGGSSSQAKSNLARAQRIAAGTTTRERIGDTIKGAFGIQSGYAGFDTKLGAYDQLNSLMNGEDAVKYQEQSLARANEALSEARLKLQEAKATGDNSLINQAREKLIAAERNVKEEDNRLSGIKNVIFEAIAKGKKVKIDNYSYEDADGVFHENEGVLSTSFTVNGSMLAAYDKVSRVSGKKYTERSEFKKDRYGLQEKRTKNTKS